MHKLTRPSPPICLASYNYKTQEWVDVSSPHKSQIWLKLDEMQLNRCAYCERAIKTNIDDSNSHIEHLRQRKRYKPGTFDWRNIFGSCNKLDSCGNYKDGLPAYIHLDVIKMDDEDPEHFLEFLPDGSVVARDGLSSSDKHRAEETIRIFNLDGTLRKIRESHLQGYIQTAEEFAGLAEEYDEADWLPLLEEELASIKHLPFATAIKHILLPA